MVGLGPTSYDPAPGAGPTRHVDPHPGRGKYPETITGTGEDELAAMIDLRLQLDERRGDRLAPIDRLGSLGGSSGRERSCSEFGRSWDSAEPSGSCRQYPEGHHL